MKRSTIYLTAALLFTSGCGTAKAETACTAARDFAAAVLAEMPEKAVVFSDTGPIDHLPLAVREWKGFDDDGAGIAPPDALASTLGDGQIASALPECAELRGFLDQSGIGYGPDAVKAATHLDAGGPFDAVVVGISMPEISDDRRHALLMASAHQGSLAGQGMLIHLMLNQDGIWQAVGRSVIWIS